MGNHKLIEHKIQSVKEGYNGVVLKIGDTVKHEGSDDPDKTAVILGFYWDTELGELRANTTQGHAGICYLEKINDGVTHEMV